MPIESDPSLEQYLAVNDQNIATSPRRRYSAVFVLDASLRRLVLVHKLSPEWQRGRANVPGGKVDAADGNSDDIAFRVCAARELLEETGLDVVESALLHFASLKFPNPGDGGEAECCFYACVGDVDAARTMERERIFVAPVADVLRSDGGVPAVTHDNFCTLRDQDFEVSDVQDAKHPQRLSTCVILTMSNLPWLLAMATQQLRGVDAASWPLTVVEATS